MIILSRTQFHFERRWGQRPFNIVVAAFNQEKALVGAFSVVTNLWMDLFELINTCTLFKVPTFSCTLDHVAKFWVEIIVVEAGL